MDQQPVTEAIDTAYERVGDLTADLDAEDLRRSTPCEGWDVSDLLDHLASNTEQMGRGLRGEQPQWGGPPSGDAVTTIIEGLRANSTIRREPEAMEREVMPGVRLVDMNLVEVVGHAWDLAQALDTELALPDATLQAALAAYDRLPLDQMRGSSFADAIVVADDASDEVRLMALLGRRA